MSKVNCVDDVVRRLNDGFDRTDVELQKCKEWLLKHQAETGMSLDEIDDMCWKDSDWVFNQIFC